MTEHIFIGLASIIILGVGAQWLAWRLQFPSILFLLVFGFAAGPLTGFIDPDNLLGDLLLPVVSISVGIILFEGGLSLRVRELREIGHIVRNFITIGVCCTWVIGAVSAHVLLGITLKLSILLGAILVVTGPTVIGPLLRHIRPTGHVGNILKWEGILIDPVGAILAVLVFQIIFVAGGQKAGFLILVGLLKTIVLSGIVGVIMALILIVLLRRYWIPDFLHQTVTLMLVIAAFLVSNLQQQESGLLTVTIMGITLANQGKVAVKHIVEFKENLRVLIISSLFILLAARMHMSDLEFFNVRSALFLGALMLLARPLSVFMSTLRSRVTWRERLFLAWMAPRGIVAAAVCSVFALQLSMEGFAQTEYLVPVTFLVIFGTVVIYGLTAPLVALWMGLAEKDPQGILIIGAHTWARAMAKALQEEGFRILLVDSNRVNIRAARMIGLPAYHGNILSEYAMDEIELSGIGRSLAVTSNDEANSLASCHLREILARSEIYQLVPHGGERVKEAYVPQHMRGRFVFGPHVNYERLSELCTSGAVIEKIDLTKEFDFDAFTSLYGDSAVPLFVVKEGKKLDIVTIDAGPSPQPGQSIIAFIDSRQTRRAEA
ncbi:MAG: sodium:proton antiporter [Gemmatimonadota bacterium]|nr:MAG: sodium:proton antiporter [Gemmatimonadota bacterium]